LFFLFSLKHLPIKVGTKICPTTTQIKLEAAAAEVRKRRKAGGSEKLHERQI